MSVSTDIDYNQPSESFLRGIDIHTLLPQQEPFVMIGALTHYDSVWTVCETPILESNIFVDGGKMTSSGLIENIAQTCACRIGYVNKYILKKGIQIGFIGAVRNFKITDLPAVGETITTTIEVKEEIFGMILAEATVKVGEKCLATAEMKIAIQDSEIN